MGLSRRQFNQEFKLAAVRRLEQGVSIAEVARGLEVNPNVLHRWRREFRQGPGNAFPGNGKQRWSEGPRCGTGTESRSAGTGDRFFEGVLAAHRGTADAAGTDWESAVFRKVKEEVKADRGLTVKRMVKLARVSRASYLPLRRGSASTGPDPDMDLRDAIQRIALEWPSLRSAADDRRVAPSRLDREPEAGLSHHARRQFAVLPEAEVRGDDRFQPWPENLSEPGAERWC